MADNFFKSMLSEGGKISSKRFLSLLFSAFAVWAGSYSVVNYKEYALTIFGYTLIIIGLLTGVATLAQIISLVKGTPPPKEDTETTKKD